MARTKTYDFIAIGGGSAGFNAARTAADLGKSVAVIDGAKELGGLCILRGCMPSKTLLYATDVLHLAQHGRDFGLTIPQAKVDMKALHARKRKVIGEFASYRDRAMNSGRYDIYRSQAKFIDPHTVETRCLNSTTSPQVSSSWAVELWPANSVSSCVVSVPESY